MKVATRYPAVLLMLLMLTACGEKNFGLTPISDTSPQEIAIWVNNIYVAQYDAYQAAAAMPIISEEHKQILRQRKAILEQVYPMLQVYNAYVDQGIFPEQATTDLIIALMERLILMGGI